jgi:hypothetical protein
VSHHRSRATRVATLLLGLSLAACGSDPAQVGPEPGTAEAPGAGASAEAGGSTPVSQTAAPPAPATAAAQPTDARTAAAALKAHPLGTLRSSGPIVVDARSDVTISGLRISNPGGPCILVRNAATRVTITGNEIGPCGGHGVEVVGSREITVAHNNLSGIAKTAVHTLSSREIRVRDNFVDGASTGYRAIGGDRIEIEFNGGINVRGPYPDGQLVQLDNVNGPGIRVQCNATDRTIGAPDPAVTTTTPTVRSEDGINTWMARGAPGDPILIAWNRIKGGSSKTGTGILAGDGGGAYITVQGNRVVNPWNVGIGVASGTNIVVQRNRVYTDNPPSVTSEGFYIKNFYPEMSACDGIVHRENEIRWLPNNSTREGWSQAFWAPAGQCTNVTGTSTNDLAAPLTRDIFTEPIAECRARAAALGLPAAGW